MSRTLYLTRNGLLEPLGQSQVFAYLRGLSQEHSITLITYEKPEDWDDHERMEQARASCETYGIRWLPQRFQQKPRVIASAISMLRMTWLVCREVHNGRAELVHARSYIPAAVALAVNWLTRVPFIFDMRALWPEEMITAGRLKRGSFLHRTITWIERTCLKRAGAVVSLTEAALEYLRSTYPHELINQRVVVIPTCADLERFIPMVHAKEGAVVHGCIGTVLSGWFRTNWLASWLKVASQKDPAAQFDIVTRDNAQQVRQALDSDGQLGDRLHIGPRAPAAMPDAVRAHDMSIMFYAGGEVSELGRSPTRMAEVLGCGLPVVANSGVGDVASIISENRVGVLVEGPSHLQMASALDALNVLKKDPELPNRCRKAAEEIFSLEAGTKIYRKLYGEVLREKNS